MSRRTPLDPLRPCFRSFYPGHALWLTRGQARRLDLLMYVVLAVTGALWFLASGWIGLVGFAALFLVGWILGRLS
jgi:hypothetical protein